MTQNLTPKTQIWVRPPNDPKPRRKPREGPTAQSRRPRLRRQNSPVSGHRTAAHPAASSAPSHALLPRRLSSAPGEIEREPLLAAAHAPPKFTAAGPPSVVSRVVRDHLLPAKIPAALNLAKDGRSRLPPPELGRQPSKLADLSFARLRRHSGKPRPAGASLSSSASSRARAAARFRRGGRGRRDRGRGPDCFFIFLLRS
jgi:hypothetical protein